MAVFTHCAALLSFSPRSFKSAVIVARAVMKHCFPGYQLWHMRVRIVFPVGHSVYPIVSPAHCAATCACIYIQSRNKRGVGEIRQSEDVQRCNGSLFTQTGDTQLPPFR